MPSATGAAWPHFTDKERTQSGNFTFARLPCKVNYVTPLTSIHCAVHCDALHCNAVFSPTCVDWQDVIMAFHFARSRAPAGCSKSSQENDTV